MKTKELIRQLQEADPTGEIECCVGNADIHFVQRLPAYYDGTLEVLVRDPEKRPFCDIVSGKRVSTGQKVNIHFMPIADAISEWPDFQVDYSEDHHAEEHKQLDALLRQQSIALQKEIDQEVLEERNVTSGTIKR